MQLQSERLILISVTAFAAVSALGGGIGIATTNGMGMPLVYLQMTPFATYVVPGLILSLVVGGSALGATVLVSRRHPWEYVVSFGAGAIMLGWILGEIVLIRQLSWLQGVYALNGLLMMGLAWLLAFEGYHHAEQRFSPHR